MGGEALAIAKRFAKALDDADHGVVAELLADDCQYSTPKGVFVGLDAIIDSYRAADGWAKAHIQGVQYESTVRQGSDDSAVIEFTDHLEHDGRRHRYACEQLVMIASRSPGRIYRITHRDLPGEREALNAFLQSIGVSRT